MATATLRKWGNSQGIVIPRDVCDRLGIGVGDAVELDEGHRSLTVRPKRACTLDALMEGYDGPMPGEYDWGAPAGKEMWQAVVFSKGDIVEFDFSPSVGHEPAGRRPALVVSRDKFNISTSMTLVCPVTTRANPFPLHLELPGGLETYGVVAVEQVRAFDLEARRPKLVESIDADSRFMRDVDELLHSFI